MLTDWCTEHFGSGVAAVLFRAGYFSEVIGVVLRDGTRSVVKIRPAAPRLAHCAQVQAALFGAGYPVAELLVPPAPYGDHRVASAEALVENPCGAGTPAASARLLAEQVRLAPALPPAALAPPPAWVRWDHDEPGLWPTPDDAEVDLNARTIPWLDTAAAAARELLVPYEDQAVVGHVDWVPQNLWWNDDGTPRVVHDWDSLGVLPEVAVAGVAAALYVEQASVADTARFLSEYQAATRPWPARQVQAAWAAGLWVRLFDAKKDLLAGRSSSLDEQQLTERRAIAGL